MSFGWCRKPEVVVQGLVFLGDAPTEHCEFTEALVTNR